MLIRLSKRVYIFLPAKLRNKLHLRAGDEVLVTVETGRVVLTPRKWKSGKARIITDPLTGLPVLSAGDGAPILTSRRVRELLGS